MDPHIRELAAAQADVVAVWQLLAAGATRAMVEQRVRDHGWRRVHSGVYVLARAPLTQRQQWMAAALTAPDTALSHFSALDCYGVRPHRSRFQTVTRPGRGGRRRHGAVWVWRSTTLVGEVTVRDGVPITTPERTLIDVAANLHDRAVAKAFREAIRLKLTTAARVGAAVARHPGRRGTALLVELARRYSRLPFDRTRSDAEARALVVLHDAGVEPPLVNVRIAGEEADLLWPDWKLIIEIDGPQFHLFKDEDARKQGIWEEAGYTVRRISSDAVFDEPWRLVSLARRPQEHVHE